MLGPFKAHSIVEVLLFTKIRLEEKLKEHLGVYGVITFRSVFKETTC